MASAHIFPLSQTVEIFPLLRIVAANVNLEHFWIKRLIAYTFVCMWCMWVCRPERIRKNVNNLFKMLFGHIQQHILHSFSLSHSLVLYLNIIFSPRKFMGIYCCWYYYCCRCRCCGCWRVWQEGLAQHTQAILIRGKQKLFLFFSL